MLSGTSRVRRALVGLAVPLLVLGAAGCGLEKTERGSSSPTAKSDSSDSAKTVPDGTCVYEPDGSKAARDVEAPPAEPDLKDSYTVTLDTSIGDLELVLDPARTPCTVNNFVSLAEQGYYDDTNCHRIIPGFMAQCGDPTPGEMAGTGGPGYSFDDELYGDEDYSPGAVAMANSGPATNGSQFFIVTGDATHLTTHTIFGQATDASLQKLLDAEKKGSGIQIKKATVS